MIYSQKRTCKGCKIEGESICETKKEVSFMLPDKPIEHCFKPLTEKELSQFLDIYLPVQAGNHTIERLEE